MRYSLSTLLVAFVILAIITSWFVDRRRLAMERDQVSRQLAIEMKRNLLAAESYETRRAQIAALAQCKDPCNVPLLLFALTDPDLGVRKTAFSALSSMRLGDEELRPDGGDIDPEVEAEILFWVDVINQARRNTVE